MIRLSRPSARCRAVGLAILCFGVAAPAAAQSQGEMNEAACATSRDADADLNDVYQQAMARWADAPEWTRSLRTAQRAWLAFRDAHLDALFPGDPDHNRRVLHGSMYPMLRCDAIASLTRARTEQLRDWVECEGTPSCVAGRTRVGRD